jgi:small-conductance mechanosensitive channel
VPPFDPAKLLDLARWFNPQPGPASSWYTILGAGFLIAIVIGIYLVWLVPRHFFGNDRYHAQLAANIGQGILWVATIGLIVVIFRLLDVGFFGMRLWLLLDAIAALVLLGYLLWYLRTVYPQRIAAIERQRRNREFVSKRRR